MSDTYHSPDEYRPLTPEEQALICSSMFTSTALMSKLASELCSDSQCTHDHQAEDFEVIVPFLEIEGYYETGGSFHGFIPIQLIPGLVEAASKTLATMFPGWGSLSGETMQMPDTLEDWPTTGDNNE